MKKIDGMIVALMFAHFAAMVVVAPPEAYARGRGRYSSGGSTGAYMDYVPTPLSTEKTFYGGTLSLEQIAQYRAEWLAERETLDHNIHGYVPKCPTWQQPGVGGEGIGCASGVSDYRQVATCICGSTVIADGHAVSKSGTTYRVRLFR